MAGEDVSSALVGSSDVATTSLVVSGESPLVSEGSVVSAGALVVSGASEDVVTAVDVGVVDVAGAVVVGAVVMVTWVVLGSVVVMPVVVEVAAGGFTLAGPGPVVVDTCPDTAASPSSANARSQAEVSFSQAVTEAVSPPKQTNVIVPLGQKPGLRRDLACRGSLVFVIVSP